MMTRRGCVKLLGLSLTSLTVLTGCEKMREIARGKGKTTEAQGTSSGDWLGFTAYPGARQLCNEFTLGFTHDNKPMEIHWVTFATRDAPEDVIAFYSKRESGKLEVEGKSATLNRGNPVHAVLSINAASAAHYHTCAGQPLPEEKTVIDLSNLLRP